MKYTTLPDSDIKISKICLGTMTYGKQNTEREGHAQLDYAVERGINFIDTAEMYPIAGNAETFGSTDKIIGTWLNKNAAKRSELVIATKIAGPNRGMEYIRKPLDFSPKSIHEAVNVSLKNLQTDYIDLYQLHWPERKINMFGQRGYQLVEDGWKDNFNEILKTFEALIKAGKIRAIGVSNETPWGVMKFLNESEKHGLPRISTIQNAYSLLNRLFEGSIAEISHRENVGLLAYSPLAFSILTGKHLQGIQPDSRIGLFPQFTRYSSTSSTRATGLYQELAHAHGLTLAQLALAFVQQQAFVTSTIIGATNLGQLKENIDTHELVLSKEIVKEINKIQELIPDPAP